MGARRVRAAAAPVVAAVLGTIAGVGRVAAQAPTTLYDTGAPSLLGGYLSSGPARTYSEFTLGAGGTVSGFRFFESRSFVTGAGTLPPSLTGPVQYQINALSDPANPRSVPGALLWSGSAATYTTAYYGTSAIPNTLDQYVTYQYDVATPSFTLAPGTYWFSVYLSPSNDDLRYWAVAADERGGVLAQTYMGATVVSTGQSRPTYALFGSAPASTVPEPGTWALLGTGLLGVGAAARRRATA